ncbi:MAG: fibronectin type III domain-containing protein [Opitutales bacterium]
MENKSLLLILLMAFAPLLAHTAQHVRALEPSAEPIHVRVLFESHPSHEAVVAWTTTAEGEAHRLYYDTEPRQRRLANGQPIRRAYRYSLPSTHSAPYTLLDQEAEAGMQAWSHNVYLNDLKPGTAYYLTVVSDGKASE